MTKKLAGKTILVTGGARRIGKAISMSAAGAGANVIIHSSSKSDEARATQAEVQASGVKSWLFIHNFENTVDLKQSIEELWKRHPFDLLVNNAAIFEPLSLYATSLEDWERHMAVNLTAPFLISQVFAKLLPEDREGAIVNILDWRAMRPGKDHFPYTITKSGLAAMTQSLALSLAPRMVVNGVALGAILPPSDGGSSQDVIKNVPAGRWAELAEVQEVILFLLSGPKYITGEIIHVDGGRHLV